MRFNGIELPSYITDLCIAYIQATIIKEDDDVLRYFEDLIFDWLHEENVPILFHELIFYIYKEKIQWQQWLYFYFH